MLNNQINKTVYFIDLIFVLLFYFPKNSLGVRPVVRLKRRVK